MGVLRAIGFPGKLSVDKAYPLERSRSTELENELSTGDCGQGDKPSADRFVASPRIKKAEELYQSKLRSVLEPAQKGKYVAIDIASGDYFVGSEILEAYKMASQKYPDRTFVYKRIGYPAARFVGSR